MSILPNTWFSKPKNDDKISVGTLGYINVRIRQRAYDLVIREFKRAGISQATLARRWGKAPEIVSRFLARPGNWELNTLSEALFAISGAILSFETIHVEENKISSVPPTPPKAAFPSPAQSNQNLTDAWQEQAPRVQIPVAA
jgi:hypothetical protein